MINNNIIIIIIIMIINIIIIIIIMMIIMVPHVVLQLAHHAGPAPGQALPGAELAVGHEGDVEGEAQQMRQLPQDVDAHALQLAALRGLRHAVLAPRVVVVTPLHEGRLLAHAGR